MNKTSDTATESAATAANNHTQPADPGVNPATRTTSAGPTTLTLLCHRCSELFETPRIKTMCNPCILGGALLTPDCAGT